MLHSQQKQFSFHIVIILSGKSYNHRKGFTIFQHFSLEALLITIVWLRKKNSRTFNANVHILLIQKARENILNFFFYESLNGLWIVSESFLYDWHHSLIYHPLARDYLRSGTLLIIFSVLTIVSVLSSPSVCIEYHIIMHTLFMNTTNNSLTLLATRYFGAKRGLTASVQGYLFSWQVQNGIRCLTHHIEMATIVMVLCWS